MEHIEEKRIPSREFINESGSGKDFGKVTYNVAGQEITLSVNIVRRYLTNGNDNIPESDIIQFISLCKFNELNPFLKEAYLIKYGSQPAQMVVSKEALFKRAESNLHYNGFRAGVIVYRNNQVHELEGCFFLKDDVLLGGWCEVYRDDRKYPIVAKVRLDEYDKRQSIWSEKKSTMICKVAKAQAMREAFPAQLGALYTSDEQSAAVDDQGTQASMCSEGIAANANMQVIDMDANPQDILAAEHVDEEPLGEIDIPDWTK